MTELLDRISALLGDPTRDLDQIEGTLTDGYAKALSLEAEGWRLERRIEVLSQEIEQGDIVTNARELADVARRLERNRDDLAELRRLLGKLRRSADDARVGSPTR
jgi:chromosome segregation ATPase